MVKKLSGAQVDRPSGAASNFYLRPRSTRRRYYNFLRSSGRRLDAQEFKLKIPFLTKLIAVRKMTKNYYLG
jgi:hypothetical protein